MIKRRTCLFGLTLLFGLVAVSQAATVFSDDFSTSTLNAASAPSPSATSYDIASSKNSSGCSIATGNFKILIPATTSGFVEAQALFANSPVALTTVGDYLELTASFTVDANIISGLSGSGSFLCYGLFNSGGSVPLTILGNSGLSATTGSPNSTGGVQNWLGYVSRVATLAASSTIITRPAQSGLDTSSQNQDLIGNNWGGGAFDTPAGVTLDTLASTSSLTDLQQYTLTFRVTLTAANTYSISSKIFAGIGTGGSVVFNQTAAASGANFLTSSFDGLVLGYRYSGTSAASSLTVNSLSITTATSVDPGNTVAGIYFQQQPTDAITGNPISPAVAVGATNSVGNPVTNASISLSLLSGSGPLNGTLSETTDASGIATFTDLSFATSGDKQLRATAGIITADSSVFSIANLTRAFPGAEGAGANTVGGRGGDVYYVTTLTDNNSSGSLRYGISTAPAGGRTICFKVSGNIVLNSALTVNKPRITIAGQTAPGDGICFQNYSFNIAANEVIVRHLRSRLGTNALQEADCMWINSGTNIIVDHFSASWSVDEVLSASRAIANLTVQNCFITEALNNSIHVKGSHAYGGILSSDNWTTFSYLRNLYAHNRSRNPRIGSSQDPLNPNTLRLDFRNNVIYDYGDRAGYTAGDPESCEVNYVNNYCIKGPSSTFNYILYGGGPTTHVYQSGNFIDLNLNGLADGADTGWGMFSGTYTQFGTPFNVPAATTESASVAYQRVVALSGAMPWRRDSNDQRIASTVREQNGMIIDAVSQVGTWPTLSAESAPADSDNDGMPDYWELANGSNPNLSSDRNITNTFTGYTKLEDYLNWLADAHALCNKNGFVDVNLRTATGGATNLSYAVANDLNGTATLLGDGYTARFTAAANTSGIASFTFTATGDGITFGPVNYGILITTTNAPVINTPPLLAAITNRTVIAGNIVNFTCSVTDTDTPPQTITFALQNGPAGTTLATNTGTFNWRPLITQSNTTNTMSIIASDNGSPSMSATQSFTVTVLHPAQPNLQSVSLAGGALQFQVTGDTGPDYAIETSTNLVNWTLLTSTNAPTLPWLWTDSQPATLPASFYRIKLGPPLP